MKVSKVNHTKVAIAEDNQTIGGILYKTPKFEKHNIKKRVEELTLVAAALYKIFPNTKEKWINEIFSSLIKKIKQNQKLDDKTVKGILNSSITQIEIC